MNLNALHDLNYGIYIVSSRKSEKINGQIANTVFQVTSEPPTIAVSINKKNLTWEYIKDSRVLTVSILCEDTPMTFIGRFGFKSGKEIDKFADIEYIIGQTKAPVVTENAVAYLEAKVINDIDVGTHTLFIGEIVNSEIISDKTCMTYNYYHQVKRGKTPEKAPNYIGTSDKKSG